MQKLKQIIAKLYWKIFKPQTRGARILLSKGNSVLLVKHASSNHYFLPGGGVNKNESFENAAKRELFEETGIMVENIQLLGTYINNQEGKNDTIKVFYANKFTESNYRESKEIEKVEWFPVKELPINISPGTKRRIEEYKKGQDPVEKSW